MQIKTPPEYLSQSVVALEAFIIHNHSGISQCDMQQENYEDDQVTGGAEGNDQEMKRGKVWMRLAPYQTLGISEEEKMEPSCFETLQK